MNPHYASIASRANHRCEYCNAPEAIFNFPFEVEHIVPRTRGGQERHRPIESSCRPLMLPTPLSAIVVSATFFGILHLTSPFVFAEDYRITTWLLFILCMSCIAAPTVATLHLTTGLRMRVRVDSGINKQGQFLTLTVWFMLFASILGAGLKVFDLFVARGFSLSSNVNELYDQNRDVEASMAGLVASLSYPLAYPALVVIIAIRHSVKSPRRWLLPLGLALVCCFVAPLNSVLLGKRGAMFSIAILLLLASTYSGFRIKLRTFFASFVVFLMLFVFSSQLLSHRLELKGGSSEGAVEAGRFTDLLDLNRTYRSVARHRATPDSVRSTMYDWATFHAYIIHAVPEFMYAVEHFDPSRHQYGRYTFSLVAKFLSYFSDVHYDPEETASVPPRTYIYSTLFGPLFFDFGYWCPLVCLGIGVAFDIVFYISRRTAFAVPFYLYLYTVVVLSPMICFISMFYGFYYAVSCIAAWAAFTIASKVRQPVSKRGHVLVQL